MGFLDNSGDIILDAVLTDTGRMRLAKGDGSFRITKFALGDDEINYALYDKNNSGGTAYFDLNIMQTPVFEAFSNNIASLNSRLISISRNNLLYLPVMKINDKKTGGSNYAITQIVQNGYILAVDKDTTEYLLNNTSIAYNGTSISQKGILNGYSPSSGETVRIDQGIDNTNIPATIPNGLDPDLVETQYLVEIDNRFGSIVDKNGGAAAIPSYIDDDDMAAYYFSLGVDTSYIEQNTNTTQTNQVIAGARGTSFSFRIKSALEVGTSDFLFYQLGTDITSRFTNPSTATNVRSIISTVRITGLTTGYAIDVPIVLIKKIS